jgi:hypothetical protein
MPKLKFFLLISFLTVPAWAAGKITYPKIEMLQGSVFWVKESIQVEDKKPIRQERPVSLKKNTLLKDQALIQTSAGAKIGFRLNDHANLEIDENSLVEFPSIHWKNGVINEIRLRKGRVRYICERDCDLKISSALHEAVMPVGDYLFFYDEKIPEIQLLVLSGEAIFRGLENEVTVTLREGEKAFFTGVFSEEGVIAYDVLLKGRKLAQGKLSDKQKLSQKELDEIKKSFEPKKKNKKSVAEKKEASKRAGQICSRPPGSLDQCVWSCEKNRKSAKDCDYDHGAQCLRRRCNANGQWADETVLPLKDAKCSAGSFVAACDY